MKRITAIAAIAALSFTPAVAANATETPPVKSGWVWHLPDGTIQGQCAEGYRPIWGEIPDYAGAARYWGGYLWDVTFQEIADAGLTNGDPKGWGYTFENGYERIVETPEAGKLYEGDCILVTHDIPGGENDGSDDVIKPTTPPVEPTTPPVVVMPKPEPTTPPVVVTPKPEPTTPPVVVTPKPEPTTPPVVVTPKPTPVKPKPVITKRVVQVDNYFVKGAAEARRVNAYPRDGVLKYREDREQWPDSRWSIQEQTFVDGKLKSSRILKTGGNATRGNTKGKTKVTQVYRLNHRATVNAPWGAKKNLDQVFVFWSTL